MSIRNRHQRWLLGTLLILVCTAYIVSAAVFGIMGVIALLEATKTQMTGVVVWGLLRNVAVVFTVIVMCVLGMRDTVRWVCRMYEELADAIEKR